MKIYTRKGDDGQSFLASGVRGLKTDQRFEVLGDLDELSAWLGLIVSQLTDVDKKPLLRAQAACLAAGAWAAEAEAGILTKIKDTVQPEDVISLEQQIDELSTKLPELTSFILPGGTVLSAQIQLSRAVARRLERSWLTLPRALSRQSVWPVWREYWNRLSDYLFVLARYVNQQSGVTDLTWKGQS
jgi:cob(I)alamin adenosyltransferase